jgi:hypothetical protein
VLAIPFRLKLSRGDHKAKPFIHDVNQLVRQHNEVLHENFVFRPLNTRKRSGGDRRDRTDDLKLAKLPLSQLSYVPAEPQIGKIQSMKQTMVGLGRLELPTSRLSSARSNQLSYRPELVSQALRMRPEERET